MKIKGIIFDMDGVIFDSEKIYLKIWTQVFGNYGYNFEKKHYVDGMGIGKEKISIMFKEIFGQDLQIDKMYDERNEILKKYIKENQIELKYGVKELLKYLKENNYKTAIATSSKKERVEKFLNSHNITEYFDEIVCADDINNFKPNPEIFIKACQKLDVNNDECLVIEDSKAGLLASKNANIKSIHIPDLREVNDKNLYFKIFKDLIEFKFFLENEIYLIDNNSCEFK